MDGGAGISLDTTVVLYLLFWVAAAWFGGYARHMRQTAHLVERKLAPELPRGRRVPLPAPWFARHGLVENAVVVAVLAYGLVTLNWVWVLVGFALFLFALLPLATRFLTPHAGTWHYVRKLRRGLQVRLAENEQRGDREGAELVRIALDRLDKGV